MLALARKRGGREGAPGRTGERPTLLVQMAARIGRDSFFYTLVTGSVFPIALVNAIFMTRLMSTSEFGQLGILFFASGLMTVALNLFFLRGTERQVWGAADEGVDVDVAELVEHHERPRVLGTGLAMSAVIGLLAVAATVPLASQLSQLLVGTPRLGTAVLWTAASGALGSTWRLAANIGRWERRRGGFGAVWVLRPVLGLVIGVWLVHRGHGVAGAMAGVAIGTLLSLLLGLVISRHSYQLVLDRLAVRRIAHSSAAFAAMVIGLFILHNGDVFLLSRYVSTSQVGVYKLATNVTSVVSYAVSAFLMAWAPLEFSTLFRAAYDRHGKERLRAEFTHYYLIVGIFLVLLLSALATPLISLFAPSYGAASGYVAITGVGYLAYGLFLVVARSSSFPRRYFVYGLAALASGAGLVVTSMILAPSLGGYGVAIGNTVGGLVGVAVIIFVAAIWGELPAASPWRIGGVLVIGGACWAIGGPLAGQAGALSPVLKVASVVLFAVLLVLTGVIPARQLSVLRGILRNSLRSKNRDDALLAGTEELPLTDRRVLVALTRDGQRLSQVSARTGLGEHTVRLRLVAALRRVSGAGPSSQDDLAISEYLLDTDSITERDAVARTLWDEGVEPVDLHRIESAFRALSEAPAGAWPERAGEPAGGGKPLAGTLDRRAAALLDDLIRRGLPGREVASGLGISERDLDRELVAALRAMAGDDRTGGPADSLIGAFLRGGQAAPPVGQLWAAGVDPLELHRLQLAVRSARAMSAKRWRRMAGRAGAGSAPAPDLPRAAGPVEAEAIADVSVTSGPTTI